MDSKLVEDVEATLRDAEYMAHCGRVMESLLQRCLESLRWKTEGDPPVDVWVLFFRHSTGEYMVDIPDKDEMPGEWKRGGWTHWLPIPQ